MSFSFRRISKKYLSDILDLFAICFKDDPYYLNLFGSKEALQQNFRANFSSHINYCLESGESIGVFDHNKLIGFLLSFDFEYAKLKDREILKQIFGTEPSQVRNFERIKSYISGYCFRTKYLLLMAVHPDYRKQGIASALISGTLQSARGKYSLAGDVSNRSSLAIYQKNDFKIIPLGEDYFFVCKHADDGQKITFRDTDNKVSIRLILPVPAEQFGLDFLSSLPHIEQIHLKGFQTDVSGCVPSFVRAPFEECTGYCCQVSYRDLLKYQRFINLSQYEEVLLPHAATEPETVLYANSEKQHDTRPLYNQHLCEMLERRQDEWKIIPDIQILFPICYQDINVLCQKEDLPSPRMAQFLKNMDFRTFYEAGLRKDVYSSDISFAQRIKRIYLGKVKLSIYDELDIRNYSVEEPNRIGQPAFADIFVTVDKKTQSGVLILNSFSLPFLVSQFMDNIIRKQLIVDVPGGKQNFLQYIQNAFSIDLQGTPKFFVTIPEERQCLSENQTAALLMSETIYDLDEQLGRCIDSDILNRVTSKNGMGQYDRAFVVASSNVLLQFSDSFRKSVCSRVEEEAITLFYLELILLEEASLMIMAHKIYDLIFKIKKYSVVRFIREIHILYSEFFLTSQFRNLKLNYPSSQASITMIRNSFNIPDMERKNIQIQEELHNIFETKRDIADRIDLALLNLFLLSLTLIQGLSILIPDFFAAHEFSINTISLIGIFLVVFFVIKWISGQILLHRFHK